MDRRPFTLRDAIRGIYQRKFRVAIFAMTVLVLVGVATVLSPKTYFSDSKIFVRLGRENVGLDATTTLGEGPNIAVPLSREDEINSVVELIKSKSLLETVVDSIGASRICNDKPRSDNDETAETSGSISGAIGQTLKNIGLLNDLEERERAVIKLSEDVSVHAVRKSNVIVVGYEAKDPVLAQEIVGKLIDVYLTHHVGLHRNTGAVEFLRAQTQTALSQLLESEKGFEEFKNKTGMISLIDQRKALVGRMAKLENDYLESVATSKSLDSEVERLRAVLADTPETVVVSKTVGAGNEGVDGMRQDLFQLEMKHEEMAARLAPDHPSVLQLETQMDRSRKLLAKVESQRTESVVGRNKVYDETKVELLKKEPLLFSTNAKSEALKTQLEQLKSQLTSFNANESKFSELQRVVKIREDKYQKYAKNLDRSEIDSSLQSERLSNISVAQSATLNPKPIWPNKLLNLVLGLFAGVFGGCSLAIILEYFDPSVRTREDIEAALDVPVVATVPAMRPSQLPATYSSHVSS